MANWLRACAGVISAAASLAVPGLASAQTPAPATILVDRDMTTAAGVSDVLAAERLLANLEDRLLPIRLQESTPARHAAGIAYRLGKWAAIDLPADSFLMVAAHEIFGHGARLREIDANGIGYRFHAPPPYGSGSAATAFDETSFLTASRADRLAIDAAGIEAQNLLADAVASDALSGRTISYRDAWLYLESRLSAVLYIRSVSPLSEPGHDAAAFLRDFNGGCTPPLCTPIQVDSLRSRALLTLADPMLAFSAYAFAASYLVQGRPASGVPMIPLPHGYGYLPALGLAMTPYGTEWTADHYLRSGRRMTRLSIHVGDTGTTRAWGVGVRAARAVERGRVAVDLAADLWRQPPIDATTAAAALDTGGLAAVTAHVNLGTPGKPGRAGIVGEFGCKTDGFVRGERLRAGPLVRIGLTIGM